MSLTKRELAAILAGNPDIALRNAGDLGAPAERALERGQAGGTQPVSRSLILPLPPSANRYWRSYNGRVVVSAAAKAYKTGVWLQAQQHNVSPALGPVAVYVHVYRARQTGDLDNFAKVTLDSLNGVAFQDDSQIAELHMWRHDDKDNPRVEVEIRRLA